MHSFGSRESFAIEADFLGKRGNGASAIYASSSRDDRSVSSMTALTLRRAHAGGERSSQRLRVAAERISMGPLLTQSSSYSTVVTSCPRVRLASRRGGVAWERDSFVLDEVGESSLRDKAAIIIVRRGDGWDRMIVKTYADDMLVEQVLPPGLVTQPSTRTARVEGLLRQ